jgi:hypothetical protein
MMNFSTIYRENQSGIPYILLRFSCGCLEVFPPGKSGREAIHQSDVQGDPHINSIRDE